VVAGYLPATASGPAQLVVNPVALAALEPRELYEPTTAAGVAAAAAPAAPGGAPAATAPAAADPGGNPYSFYGSVAECAAAQRDRCDACLANNACTAITPSADGNSECGQLAANGGRGYYLICINLSLAINAVASCAARDASSCARDTHA